MMANKDYTLSDIMKETKNGESVDYLLPSLRNMKKEEQELKLIKISKLEK